MPTLWRSWQICWATKGAAKQNFLDSIAHYNELCYAGVDSDYGKDAPYMVPIDTAPFFGGTSSTGHSSNPMMVTMSGVITDETQNVLNKDWEPIEGLYVAGNCLGGRYGFGYSTPFAGNSVGMAMTHGWTAGHQVASDKKFLGEPVEAMEAPAGGPGGPGGPGRSPLISSDAFLFLLLWGSPVTGLPLLHECVYTL